MKKIISLFTLMILTLIIISCRSKAVDDTMGKAIIAQSLKLGLAENIKCLDALTNQDIAIKAIKSVGGSTRGYSNWVQSDSGQKILQEAIAKCMAD